MGDHPARPGLKAVPGAQARGDAGSALIGGVLALCWLLVVFLLAANIILDEYAKGAMKTAVDDGTEAGAVLNGSLAACRATAAQVKSNLLPGPFGRSITIVCEQVGTTVVASARGPLPSLLPLVPGWSLSVVGGSVREEAPAQ